MISLFERRRFLQLACGVCTSLGIAKAQGLARRRLLIPLSSGAGIDIVARKLTGLLRDRHAMELEPENLPGAGGLLAVQRMLALPADGNTLLLANSGLINTVPELIQDGPRFDPLNDIVPLALFLRTPFVLFASSSSGIRSLSDLREAFTKSSVPKNYGISTLYGGHHIAGHLLFKRLGLSAQAVAYRQTNQLLMDLASGRLTTAVAAWGTAAPLMAKGLVQPVVVMSDQRLPIAPDLACLADLGLADAAHPGWAGIFHAAGTPSSALATVTTALTQTLRSDAMRLELTNLGYQHFYRDGPSAAKFVLEDVHRHRALLQEIRLD